MFKKRSLKKPPQIKEEDLILAALGVMSDEFNGPVPIDEINFCLRIDFKHKIKDSQLISIISHAISQNLVERTSKGYYLTSKGEVIADDVLQNDF